jgi:hypothetical protein
MSISAQINIMDYNREERDSSSSSSSNNLDPCAKLFIEMKSIQPYSTKDEYIYAMKEDLAEWFNLMYSSSITAQNFTEELENGVLICNHANNVMRAASSKSITFNQNDLYQAGIIVKSTPNSKLHTTGEYLLYKPNAKPQSFQARDNISNFIKWCRNIVKVREVLMFETEDLILRKNEKHFILCLLEVARFGSKFGIQVPTIIQMEQEIEAEMAAMQEKQKQAAAAEAAAAIQLNDRTLTSQQQVLLNVISEEDTSNTVEIANTKIIEETSYNNTNININKNNTALKKFNSNENLIYDSMINCEDNSNLINKNYNDSLEDISNLLPTDNNNKDDIDKNKINILNNKMSSSISSLSSLSSYSNEPIKNEHQSNNNNNKNNQNNMDSICNSISSYSPSYLSPLSSSSSIALSSALSNNSENNNKQNENEQNLLISAKLNQQIIYDSNEIMTKEENQEANRYTTSPSKIPIRNDIKLEDSLDQNILNESATQNNNNNNTNTNNNNQSSNNNNNNNLHKHVCSIANRCTCEKKFLVDKIGEGKYRIGNTKNIVFIRILRNHIMVRVGGGWDTLENYLNKHDPCRCPSEVYAGKSIFIFQIS